MRTALLDANVLIAARKEGALDDLLALPVVAWAVVPEVRDECARDLGTALDARCLAGVPLESEAGQWTRRLRRGGGGWNPLGTGESACIARALVEGSLDFVTFDRAAHWLAAHELGLRAWVGAAWLREAAKLAPDCAEPLRRIAAAEGRRLPRSWA